MEGGEIRLRLPGTRMAVSKNVTECGEAHLADGATQGARRSFLSLQ